MCLGDYPEDKSGISTTTAFQKLIETSKRKPQNVWSDRVKEEFSYKRFLDFLKEQNFQISSTNSDLKAVFVERFNRTLLDLIKEPMYNEGKACWLNYLHAALEKYNNRVHGTTKMTLFEMSTNNKIDIKTAKLAVHTEGASRTESASLLKLTKI